MHDVTLECRAEFKELRLLGQGNFSRVYLARGRLDGCEYAVKRSCHEVQQESLKKQWVQVGTVPGSFCIRTPKHQILWRAAE